MQVVIAEKPSVGRDIARVLGCRKRGDGYLEGPEYIVTWAIGHLVHFVEPDDYGELWKGRWSFGQLPMIPERWRLRTDKRTSKQFQIVKRLINDGRVQGLICATDAGREGEHIFRLIYEHAKCRKPWRRLWISSLTDEAIADGFRRLREGQAYDPLAQAARARAQADWLMGMNLTRAYTVHHGALYTIGRVQTPTLAMIVKREHAILNFTKAFYYEILAHLQEGFSAKYLHDPKAKDKTRIDQKAAAERLFAQLKDAREGLVRSVEQKTKRHQPPQLYDLINLQKDANRRFGLTADETLKLAQTLYEKDKLISYPRTESRHISEDMVSGLPKILRGLDNPHAQTALQRLNEGHRLSKYYVDKTKLSDHHGILPTGRRAPDGLRGRARDLYDLIVKRFVAIFFPPQVIEETKVALTIKEAPFVASGSRVVDPGWTVVDPPKKTQRHTLPPLTKGQQVQVDRMELAERETEPPKRYTDAALLTAMKNAGREVEDDALAEAMKESGLGTPATRAEMIEKLIRTRYVFRKGKVLHPTEKGMALIGVVADPLRSPETTGAWEQRLKDIEHGDADADGFYQSITQFLRELIPTVQQSERLTLKDDRGKKGRGGARGSKSKGRGRATSSETSYAFEPRGGQSHTSGPEHTKPQATKPAKPAKPTASDIGLCPNCGQGRIIEGHRAFGCTRFRQGCKLLIPKELAGKKLTLKQVQGLITKGKTGLLKGFVDDGGDKFAARLRMGEDHQIRVERGEAAKKPAVSVVGAACPKCKRGRIIEGKRGYGCNRFREGCNFVVWKEIDGKTLTQRQLLDVMEKRKTSRLKGFKDQHGASYEGRVILDGENQVRVERLG